MRRPAIVGLALLAAACGSASGLSDKDASQPAPAAPAATTSPVTATGDGLKAEVSALNADRSGLHVRMTDTATIVELPADTLFAFDSAELTPAATANLDRAAEAIRRGGAGPVGIVGHTDAKGEDDYNLALSTRRAQAVADWMGQQVGVRRRTFAVNGKGETAPVAPNARADGDDDPEGRARNRRVEMVIPR